MQRIRIISSYILVLIMFISCELSPFEESTDNKKTEESEVREESSLFKCNDSGTKYIFETNDTKYLHEKGYTLWTISNINSSNEFESLSVEVTKESGKGDAGFGIVFCEQNINKKKYMLSVLINANGFYTIGKVVDGVFTHINGGWKNSNYINRGLGYKNNINVTYDNINRNFVLSINDYIITDFTVSEEIKFKNSRSGFAAVISNNESLPNIPVKVMFEIK